MKYTFCEKIIWYAMNGTIVDFLNITPTLSEAWDIIQMEEIERELFKDFDEETE